jgi:transposase
MFLPASACTPDAAVVPVLAPELGRTKTGRVWTYVRDDRPFDGAAAAGVFYRYTPDRKGEHPRAHLQGFRGILQADGYAGFAKLYGNKIIEAACMAHARQKLFERSRPWQRPRWTRLPRLRSAPLFAELKAWLETTLSQVSRRGKMAKAIRYGRILRVNRTTSNLAPRGHRQKETEFAARDCAERR